MGAPRKPVPVAVRVKRLKKALDVAWAVAVKARDGNRCLMCGKTANLHAHHWLIRKARSIGIRWEVDNGATLCYYCHLLQVHLYSDKAFMDAFFAKMDSIVSKNKQALLYAKSRLIHKWGELELEAILVRLTHKGGASGNQMLAHEEGQDRRPEAASPQSEQAPAGTGGPPGEALGEARMAGPDNGQHP
jgi:hypothetical protein